MGRKRKKSQSYRLFEMFMPSFFKVLILMKWIGDLIIAFGIFFLLPIFKSYKIITVVLSRGKASMLSSILNLKKLKSLTFPKAKRKKKKKTVVIFSSQPKWLVWIKALSKNLFGKLSFRAKPRSNRGEVEESSKKIPPLSRQGGIGRDDEKTFQIGSKKTLPSSLFINEFFFKIKYFSLGAFFMAVIAFYYQANNLIRSLPNPAYLSLGDIPTTTKIYDRNNKLLYEIYTEKNRTPVKLNEVPEVVKRATIAIEDADFLRHKGFSLRAIARAAYHNLISDTLEGASTITQQLIRSALLTPEKTLERKIKELVLSVWAERIYTKDQILEMYLNQVPYGGTSWGIEAASQAYFGKSVKELNIGEASLLSGLPAAPTRFSPFGTHPELTRLRQEEVLRRMLELGFISKKQAETAQNQTLTFKSPAIPIAAPHFVMYVRELLEKYYGPRMVSQGGLRVTTTLDLSLQEKVQKIVSTEIDAIKNLSVGNGAALITNPSTGEIMAMIGSGDYFDKERQGNVNVVTSLRQPGSSIKVVNYAKALEMGFTSASILDDSPITYHIAGLPSYSPVNYDGRFHGKTTLRIALASSYNVPAVKVLSKIGVKNMIEQGKLMGIESWNDENRFGLSLTLGGGEVTMLDMAKVYGVLANGGIRHELTPFIKITNWKGENISLPYLKQPVQSILPEIAFILSSILSDNKARTPAFGPNSSLNIPGKTVAVKTGTSDNKRDNWTIGYTPDAVVVVWVGNNDNSPMHPQLTSGVTGAAPIWNEIMEYLLQDKQDKPFFPAENIVALPCFGSIEYFIKGTEPEGGCALPVTNTPKPTK